MSGHLHYRFSHSREAFKIMLVTTQAEMFGERCDVCKHLFRVAESVIRRNGGPWCHVTCDLNRREGKA